MTSYDKLLHFQNQKKSILCVGLDTDLAKIPTIFDNKLQSMLDFNKRIIDSTLEHTSVYKINFAFYEQYGSEGFDILKRTIEYINQRAFVIADSKRGDIGNTSDAYAKSCFEYFGADAITVAPYMGFDSVEPFLKFSDKITFILALTSNPGSSDFQRLEISGKPLYVHVIEKSTQWGTPHNTGFVTGATHPDDIQNIRQIIPNHVLLIPGVGSQGGNVEKLLNANQNGVAIINVSRDVIYAGSGLDFDKLAGQKAEFYKNEFNKYYTFRD